MNVTMKRDLRTVADVTRAINGVSLHPTVTGVQRLINLSQKWDLLDRRARLREARARSGEVSEARALRLWREADDDRRLAVALRRQYGRLSRKSRGYERSGATCD